jgi:hypothetical protein
MSSYTQPPSSCLADCDLIIYVSTDRRFGLPDHLAEASGCETRGRELFGFRKPGGPLFVMTTRTLGLLCHQPI